MLICRCERAARADAEEEDRAVLQRRGRRRVHRRRTSTRSTRCRSASTRRGSTTRSASCSTSGRARPSSTGWERVVDSGQEPASGGRRSASSASTSSSSSRTRASTRRCIHGGIAQRLPGRPSAHRLRGDREARAPSSCCADVDGILVAPGFGARGTEGKIAAVRYAREQQVPFFGICFGMQIAVIEFARNVCGLDGRQLDRDRPGDAASGRRPDARAARASPTRAATMRLGAYPVRARRRAPRAAEAYGARRDQRAPPPPLRGQQRLPRRARAPRAWCSRALSPDRPAGRDDRAAASTRTSSAASSTPSSSRGRRRRTRCSARFIARRARAPGAWRDETAPRRLESPATPPAVRN